MRLEIKYNAREQVSIQSTSDAITNAFGVEQENIFAKERYQGKYIHSKQYQEEDGTHVSVFEADTKFISTVAIIIKQNVGTLATICRAFREIAGAFSAAIPKSNRTMARLKEIIDTKEREEI